MEPFSSASKWQVRIQISKNAVQTAGSTESGQEGMKILATLGRTNEHVWANSRNIAQDKLTLNGLEEKKGVSLYNVTPTKCVRKKESLQGLWGRNINSVLNIKKKKDRSWLVKQRSPIWPWEITLTVEMWPGRKRDKKHTPRNDSEPQAVEKCSSRRWWAGKVPPQQAWGPEFHLQKLC